MQLGVKQTWYPIRLTHSTISEIDVLFISSLLRIWLNLWIAAKLVCSELSAAIAS